MESIRRSKRSEGVFFSVIMRPQNGCGSPGAYCSGVPPPTSGKPFCNETPTLSWYNL